MVNLVSATGSQVVEEDYRFNVLVVAYYFPPMGLSGVQRISKFVKYLPEYRWKPTVLTATAGSYYAFDTSLLEELETIPEITIERTASVDPTRWFGKSRTLGWPAERSRRLASWFSQLVFIPDNKIGWQKHAVEAGKKILEREHIDVIYASAPPYTALLVGLELSRLSGLPLVSDFRDDWSGNPRHVYPTPWHRRKHLRMEASVIEHSSAITTINRAIQDRLVGRHLGASGYTRVSIIPQGFDPEDFPVDNRPEPDGKFRLLYSGVFYDAQQPDTFLKGLAAWLKEHPDRRGRVEAVFVGMVPHHGRRLIDSLGLSDVVVLKGYLSHAETVRELATASVLWMTVGKQEGQETISTGKLHEYIGTRKPILGLVPDGAAQKTLKEYRCGQIVAPTDVRGTVDAIESLFKAWEDDSLPVAEEEFVKRYDRRILAGELSRVFVSTLKTD